MKKRKCGMLLVAAMLAWVMPAMAVDWMALSIPEMAAHKGATHCAVIKYKDFTAYTSTNTAAVITNNISAKQGVEFVELLLDQAFDTGNTNFTGQVSLKIGDGSDDDLFLTATELASDGTEVWVKYPPPDGATIVSTLTRQALNAVTNVAAQQITLTYLDATTNSATAVVCTNVAQTVASFLTNATVASTATIGELGRKLYTSAGYIVYTITPNAEESLSENTSGEVRLYFRVTKFNK